MSPCRPLPAMAACSTREARHDRQPMWTMAAGDPTVAIQACKIGAAASDARGSCIGRPSLKWHNPANAPDARERAVLRDFEARKAAGEDPARIDRVELVVGKGERIFRRMKAIGTRPVSTLCHGAGIKPEVAARLDALYPEDRARGFQVGDSRDAFSIAQPAP